MKKFTSLLAIALLMNLLSLKAQDNSPKPNHSLTHIMSAEEKLHANEIGQGFVPSAVPLAPVRNIAEFEPTEAAIIAYPSGGFGIPYSLIKDLSNDTKLIVAVPSSSQSSAASSLQSNGVNMANVQYLNAAVDSYWARDYSGWFIADGNNKVGVIDFIYNRPRPNDDAIPPKEATFLGIPSYGMNLTLTGGNWMCDGMGIATATDLVTDENALPIAQIKQTLLDYLGISNFMMVADAQGQYIKHMDCWGKFLAVDKMLVDSVPSSDPQFNGYQAAAAYYRNTNCSYGYPYKVYRPYIASSSGNEPYSNSFICNDKVYLAFTGSPNDNAALNLYKAAMPGYTVRGYTQPNSNAAWVGTDALHCRVHEIADRNMLYIRHMPLFGKVCSLSGYTVSTDVVSYGAQTIKAGYPMVIYKLNGGAWDSISMTLSSGSTYTGVIPYQPNGTTIQYYIKAIDATNKIAYHPFIGAPDPHTFTAECSTGVPAEPKFETYVSTYPNPNDGNFFVYLNSKKTCPATLIIHNTLGESVYNETFDLSSGISLKHIQLNNISKGIYFMDFKTDFETITQKLVIQ